MDDHSKVRVRFAPSPTGAPHIGNIRTALFNWLYARHEGGKFVLRIEDTDQARVVPGSQQAILDSLSWLGIDWDEGPGVGGPFGPYVQSQRLDLYRGHVDHLLKSGKAYHCYCTPERLKQMRQQQRSLKQPPRYDRKCRYLSEPERGAKDAVKLPSVVRFATPIEGSTTFVDRLRGGITFEHAVLDDHVLLKSDGWPTYQSASVIDDHVMEISHVIRGEDWISSAPKHVLLYQAFGWEPPIMVHTPNIVGRDRSKLSKRHGAVDALHYRDNGYLPEAMINYMALLGWALDEKTDVFSVNRLIQEFDLDRIGKNPGLFDIEKLDWMNGYYIRQLPSSELADRLYPFFDRAGLVEPAGGEGNALPIVKAIAPHIQERMKRLTDAVPLTGFLFDERIVYDPALLVPKGWDAITTKTALAIALEEIEAATEIAAEHIEARFRGVAAKNNWKVGRFFGALRIAITGQKIAPPLFASMEVLGRGRTVDRLNKAIRLLGGDL